MSMVSNDLFDDLYIFEMANNHQGSVEHGLRIVDAVAHDVRGVQPGDKVMFNPGISCYACEMCDAGEHSLCVRYQLLGEHLPGTFAEYIDVVVI